MVAKSWTGIIRDFERRDQQDARTLILDGLAEHFGGIDEALNPDLDDIWKAFPDKGNHFVVAEVGGKVAGAAGLIIETSSRGRIVRMSVHRSHRRIGVATSLLNRIIEIANRRALDFLVVSTELDWRDAIGFYTAAGFAAHDQDAVDVHFRRRLREKESAQTGKPRFCSILDGDIHL